MLKWISAATAALIVLTLASDASARHRRHHRHHVADVTKKVAAAPRVKFCTVARRPTDFSGSRFVARYELVPEAFVIDSVETAARLDEARRYLARTTIAEGPGATMVRMGREIVAKERGVSWRKVKATPEVIRIGVEANIAKMHPLFVMRLSLAIEAARAAGLRHVALFSGYRPPGYGVGGFGDKFQSGHAFGVAGDVGGIGRAGSASTLLWQRIAWGYRIYSPYGPNNRAEWNHVQATGIRMVLREVPALRRTITAAGPIKVETMWQLANRVIDKGPGWREASAQRPHVRRRHARHRWARHHRAPRPVLYAQAGPHGA